MSSVVLALVAATGQARAACDTSATNETIALTLDEATEAYESLDVEGFEEVMGTVGPKTDCLTETITPHNAATLHRMRGLAAFLVREKESSRASFAAARRIEPDYSFPDSLVPKGNPVRELYSAQDPAAGATRVLPFPKSGTLQLDGSSQLERNLSQPVIFQRLDDRGAVVESRLVAPGTSVPEYETAPLSQDLRKKRRRTVLLVGAAGVGAAAAGVYAGSWLSNGSYQQAVRDGDTAKMKSAKGSTNTLTVTAGGLTAAAVGLGTVGLLSGRF